MGKPWHLLLVVGIAASAAAPANAQDERALQQALVGQEVTIEIDMPATADGIDFYPERRPQIDFDEYSDRIAEYGTAIYAGDAARITEIKIKGQHIEFQLDGGGYGTFGDPGVPSTYVSPPPKSRRERDLEQDLRNETDPVERRRIERELDRLEDDRERQYRRDQEYARDRAEEARRRIERARLAKGSRFNVRYDRNVPAQIRTPGGLLAVLSEYVRPVGETETDVSFAERLSTEAEGETIEARVGTVLPVWKGMSEAEVAAVFGAPSSRTASREGQLEAVYCVYETREAVVEATFVSGALVRYTIASR